MSKPTSRRTHLMAALTALAVLAGVTAAAPAQAATLPTYATWIADVTAVTDAAQRYLATRLPDAGRKTAIVLDIDNTALESDYSGSLWPPATAPVLQVARRAEAGGAVVFFVSARPEIIYLWTLGNLEDKGYEVAGLYTRATFNFDPNQKMKTDARIAIEKLGYTIVANIGNNDSDLAGGHAERTFKLPDYDGQLD